MMVHVEKRNILGKQLKCNGDDGFCYYMSDTVDPQNGRKSKEKLGDV